MYVQNVIILKPSDVVKLSELSTEFWSYNQKRQIDVQTDRCADRQTDRCADGLTCRRADVQTDSGSDVQNLYMPTVLESSCPVFGVNVTEEGMT